MDIARIGTGRISGWARFVLSPLLAVGCLVSEAGAQGPAPTYEKKASWAETLVALRAQAIRQPQWFRPQPGLRAGFQLGFQPGFQMQRSDRSQEPPHPLVALWAQLEQDFPLECDWMLQDLAACGYPCSNPARAGNYPIRWFGPWADADLEKTLLLHVIEELGTRGKPARVKVERLSQARTPPHTQRWLELYAATCRTRRQERLQTLTATCPAFVFTKHFNMGGSHYTFTEGLLRTCGPT